jgi:hypothetical protein
MSRWLSDTGRQLALSLVIALIITAVAYIVMYFATDHPIVLQRVEYPADSVVCYVYDPYSISCVHIPVIGDPR